MSGDKVEFDWKSAGTDDAASIYAYLLNVDTGATIELINFTQSTDGVTTDWAKNTTNITTAGNYKFVFINGTYDATGGKALGAEMYIDNVNIVRGTNCFLLRCSTSFLKYPCKVLQRPKMQPMC